ncbi:MAG: gas vesicle protein GvpN [Negativicutes bacterium]
MRSENLMLIRPIPQSDFAETPVIIDRCYRAMAYLEAGYPVHLRGSAGTGKTSLALHIAHKIGRPVVLLHGDESSSTADLIGGKSGYRLRRVIDNFIHTVQKTEEDMVQQWADNRVTVACKYGYTLIYDEYTRSRPEANNVFLSILQERILSLPSARGGVDHYLNVHPDFSMIFTSNPEEYAGVFRSQDALRDRMITIDLDFFDKETEVQITQKKSGLSQPDAERLVNIIRDLRKVEECEVSPTVRSCIAIAKAIQVMDVPVDSGNARFHQVVAEILSSVTSRSGDIEKHNMVREKLAKLIDLHCNKSIR